MSPPFQLGDWRVEPQLNVLRRGDQVQALEPRAMDVLVYLADRPRETVSRQTLLDDVWGDTAVVDGALSRAVHALRTALGDEAREPRYIQTVQRRGYRLIAEVVREPRNVPAMPARFGWQRRRAAWIAGIAAMAVLAIGALTLRAVRPAESIAAVPESVAVMAFEDLSPDGSGALLARGATETIAAILAGIDRPRVFAPTPSTVETPEVDAWLQGSISTAGDGIRLSARLTRTDGELLWGQVYEGASSAILQLQAALASDAAAALGGAVSVPGGWRRAVDAEAYQLYLSGREHLANRRGHAFERAVRTFEQAIDIDPGFAAAHAGLAESYLLLGNYLTLPEDQARARAAAYAEKALALDPNSPEALVAGAHLAIDGGWRFADAEALARRAVGLAPGHREALITLAEALSYAGRDDEALRTAEAAARNDPLVLLTKARRAKILLRAGYFSEAEALFREVTDHAPPFGWPTRYRAFALDRLGRSIAALDVWLEHISMDRGFDAATIARAETLIREGGAAGHWRWRLGTYHERLARGRRPHPAAVAEAYAGIGEVEQAFVWLDRALEDRDDWLLELLLSPAFDTLRGPRLVAVLEPHGVAHLATVAERAVDDRPDPTAPQRSTR